MKDGVLLLSQNFESYIQPITLLVLVYVLIFIVIIGGLYFFGEDFIDVLSKIDIDFD